MRIHSVIETFALSLSLCHLVLSHILIRSSGFYKEHSVFLGAIAPVKVDYRVVGNSNGCNSRGDTRTHN